MKATKKLLALVLALAMSLSLAACGGTPASPSSTTPAAGAVYKAGTYTAEAQGNGGMVPVTVTFSDTEILSVEIGENSETAGIATPVLENFPTQIVEGQTLNIEAVSGATITSKAVLAAVADCVAQAGGDVDALKSKDKAAVTAGEPIEETADVVVIGGGGAGLAAAVSAAENGASVILIEKGAALGGNTLRAGGAYNAVDPERQASVPMDESQIKELQGILEVDETTIAEEYRPDLATLKEQIKTYLAGDTSKLFDSVELHTYQTYKGGARTGLDGTEIHGNYSLVSLMTKNSLPALNWLVSHDSETQISDSIGTVLGGLWPRMHSLTTSVGHGFISPLEKACSEMGVTIMLNTCANELITDGGRVTGVKAEKTDGTPVTLTASKGVVMATGGYGANPKMAMEYDNYWGVLTEDMPTTNSALLTGDGIIMGQAVGANLVGMGYIQLMPSSQPVTGSLGGGLWGSAEEQVFVNKEGKRFVSEYESRDVLSKAALEQTDAIFYIICDQASAGDPQPGGKNGWGNDIDTLIAEGSVLKADTLEDLAKQMGADPATFVAEMEKYNSYCATGEDLDFGKVKLGGPIDVGPFYATIRTPSIHHTMGGLEVNAQTQVLNANGDVIPGLYAAGEVAGGIHAGNRVGGNALVDIMVFGRIAGESAALEK
ncbi:MAG TPA: FAD-dependent oxidoreductase [Pseudoflavonifractor sp.]|nr:FAD-dependent oxidoreductase [Pseudoflavonifractor sp.]